MRVDASLPPESLRADIGQLIALASGDEEERLKVAVIEYVRSLETRDDARPVGEEADPAWIATEHVLADTPGRLLAALREGLPVLAGSEAPVGVWQGRLSRDLPACSRDLPAGRRSPYPWLVLAKFRR